MRAISDRLPSRTAYLVVRDVGTYICEMKNAHVKVSTKSIINALKVFSVDKIEIKLYDVGKPIGFARQR